MGIKERGDIRVGLGSFEGKRASVREEAMKLGDVGFATVAYHKAQYGRKCE